MSQSLPATFKFVCLTRFQNLNGRYYRWSVPSRIHKANKSQRGTIVRAQEAALSGLHMPESIFSSCKVHIIVRRLSPGISRLKKLVRRVQSARATACSVQIIVRCCRFTAKAQHKMYWKNARFLYFASFWLSNKKSIFYTFCHNVIPAEVSQGTCTDKAVYLFACLTPPVADGTKRF